MSVDKNIEAKLGDRIQDINIWHRLNEDGTGQVMMSYGSAVPRDVVSDFMPAHLRLEMIDNVPNDFHKLIPIMRYYYENDGWFGSVVDVIIQFTIDNTIENVTDNKEAETFFDAIVETSNIRQTLRWLALEYSLLNNAWPYREVNMDVKVRARNGEEVPRYEWTVLNPEFVDVGGSLLFGLSKIYLKPNEELRSLARSISRLSPDVPIQREMLNKIKDGESIELDPYKVYHIGRNKQPYQRYAPVALKRVVRPLRIKEKFMQMDLATADGIINQIVIFKLGNDAHPITSQEPLERFSSLLRTPSKAYQLVWNHLLEVEYVRSDPQALDPKKYETVYRELAYGFATPGALVGNSEGNYGKDWIAVKSVVERLKWAREDLEAWLEREFRIIAEENGLKTYPKPKLGKISLEEERLFKQIMIQLYDRNLLSAQTLLSETGHEFLSEVERLRVEKKLRDEEGLLIPNSPYHSSQRQDGPGRPEGTEEDERRDDRDPNPAPSGSGVASQRKYATGHTDYHVALADTEFEEKLEELYLEELRLLYEETRRDVLKVVSEEGDRGWEKVVAILLAFKEEMQNKGERVIREMYEFSYELVPRPDTMRDNDERERLYRSIVEWNLGFVDKLYYDLRNQIQDYISSASAVAFIDMVFDKEIYRLPHFARETVRKAKLLGAAAGYAEAGMTYGKWNCSFINSCEICIERHNNVYSSDELMTLFPAHPQCQCWIVFTATAEGRVRSGSSEANHQGHSDGNCECSCGQTRDDGGDERGGVGDS